MGVLDSDVGVYVAGGMLMSVCFVVAIAIVYLMPHLAVTRGTLITFAGGFAVSMGVYYLALWIYGFVAAGENPRLYDSEETGDGSRSHHKK